MWGIIRCSRVSCRLSKRDIVCMTGDFTQPCFRETGSVCMWGKERRRSRVEASSFSGPLCRFSSFICAPVSHFLVRHVRAAQSESSSTAVRIRQETIPLPSSKSVPNILLKVKCVLSTPLRTQKRIATNNIFKQVFDTYEKSTVWTNLVESMLFWLLKQTDVCYISVTSVKASSVA